MNRGFAHYEDYVLEYLVPFRTAWLVDHLQRLMSDVVMVVGRFWRRSLPPLHESWLSPYLVGFRKKDGVSINRAFVDWLSNRRQPERPFFAFLNYYDAHDPYVLPTGAEYRFGLKPRTPADFLFLWHVLGTSRQADTFARCTETSADDSYDNCVAYLDERLGELVEELHRRGVLDRTLRDRDLRSR